MSSERDWDDEMYGPTIDESTAERLLTGTLSPDDAPPGFVGLAQMIRAATGPVRSAESKRDAEVIAAALAAVRSSQSNQRTARRRKSMLTKLLSAKVAAIAAGAVLGSTGVAAAATGNLPAQAQTTVSNALAHVDVSVPKANSHSAGHGQSGASHGHGQSANSSDANGNSDFGLCTAFLAAPNDHANAQSGQNTNSGKDASTAFTNLVAAHGGSAASATAYCNGVVAQHPGNNGGNSDNQGHGNQPANPGKPGQPANPGKPGKPAQPGQSGSAGSNGAANQAAHRP